MQRSDLSRLLGAAVAALLSLTSAIASAGPQERFQSDYAACEAKYDGTSSFTCSICGVAVSCSGNQCSWGDLKSDDVRQDLTALAPGFTLYCLNQGGTLLASASPAGTQSRGLDSAFRGLAGRLSKGEIGGVVEYTKYDGGDGAYGATVPLRFSLDDRRTVSGTVMAGNATGFKQFGANARYSWLALEPAEGGLSQVLVVGVPAQVSVLTGDGLKTTPGFNAGLGAVYGFSTRDRGFSLGGAADVLSARGVQAPLQVAARVSLGSTQAIVVQPALSTDALSPVDGLQENVLVGFDLGESSLVSSLGLAHGVLGAQLFYRSGNMTGTLGLTGTPRAYVTAATPSKKRGEPDRAPSTVPIGGMCTLHADCDGLGVCIGGVCVQPATYEPPHERVALLVVAPREEIERWASGVALRALEGTRFDPTPASELRAALGDRREELSKGKALDELGAAGLAKVTSSKRVVQIVIVEKDQAYDVRLITFDDADRHEKAVRATQEELGTALRKALRELLDDAKR